MKGDPKPMDEATRLMRQYDYLWNEYDTISTVSASVEQGDARSDTRSRQAVIADMIAIAQKGQVMWAADEYRLAMWERRQWCHENGRDGDVWDGTDPLEWKAHRADRTKASLYKTGTANPSSKLVPADVRRIRSLLAAGLTGKSLAREYGVSIDAISKIRRRETWREVD